MNIGIGYVTKPSDVAFDKYIETCFQKEEISIVDENGRYYHNVKIDRWCLQLIDFPEGENLFGSGILYQVIDSSNLPYVFSVFKLNDEGQLLLPGQFYLYKIYDTTYSAIRGDGKKGTLDIVVKGGSEGGQIVERAIGAGKSKILRESDNTITDRAENIHQTEAGKKIIHGTENLENAVLGNTLVDLLGQILDAITKLTVPTMLGPSGVPINSPVFLAIKQKLKTCLSKLNELQ